MKLERIGNINICFLLKWVNAIRKGSGLVGFFRPDLPNNILKRRTKRPN